MHISFEEDVSIEDLEEALLSIPRLLKLMGVSRLSCFHMNGFAWRGQERFNLESRKGSPVLIDITKKDDADPEFPGSWQATVVEAGMLPDEHMLRQLFGR